MDEKQDSNLDAKQEAHVPRKPGTFVPGDPRINRTNGPGEKKHKPSQVLCDMRAVYGQDESKDKGPAQKALRNLFKEDLDKFLLRLSRLENAYQAGESKNGKAPKESPPAAVDIGEARSLALLEELLKSKGWQKKTMARVHANIIGANTKPPHATSVP